MTTLRETAQQALEVLERAGEELRWQAIGQVQRDLRAALAQEQAEPVQEPVAWLVYTEGGTSAYVTDNPNDLVGAYRALALYPAPPPRKPLTDDEIFAIENDIPDDVVSDRHWTIWYARAIERAHGIGEQP